MSYICEDAKSWDKVANFLGIHTIQMDYTLIAAWLQLKKPTRHLIKRQRDMTRSLEMVIEQVEILKAEEMKIEGASRG